MKPPLPFKKEYITVDLGAQQSLIAPLLLKLFVHFRRFERNSNTNFLIKWCTCLKKWNRMTNDTILGLAQQEQSRKRVIQIAFKTVVVLLSYFWVVDKNLKLSQSLRNRLNAKASVIVRHTKISKGAPQQFKFCCFTFLFLFAVKTYGFLKGSLLKHPWSVKCHCNHYD